MKKKIIIAVAVVLVIALAVSLSIYFAKFKGNKAPEDKGLIVSAQYEEVTLFSTVFDYIYKFPDRWGNSLVSNYEMNDEKAESVINHPEKWLAFNFFITVNNDSDEPIVANGLKTKNNGRNGLYIGTRFDGMAIIDPNAETSLCVTVFLNDNDPSIDDVIEMIKDMDVSFEFSSVPDDLDADIPEEDIYSVQVVM